MEENLFFNLELEEFNRRQAVNFKEHDSNAPIDGDSALSVCAAGSKRLLNENKDLLQRIYRTQEKRS